MSQEPTDNRRATDRVAVDLWVEERTDDALYYQHATSLSLGGMFLERTLPHATGTRVSVELQLPDEPSPLRVAGEVAPPGSRAAGMALRFVELSDDARGRLGAYLARASSRPATPDAH